jgi:hypothetical protein
MRPSRPPAALTKRPWYLTAALVASWIYGARALSEGYQDLAFYRGERPDVHAMADELPSAQARDDASKAGDRWLALKDGEKQREMPIGAASLLLGAAMVIFAARSMAGREGSRSALVQIVVVHAGLVVAASLLTRNVMVAQGDFLMKLGEGNMPRVDAETMAATREILPYFERALVPISAAMDAALSALIVLALTRPRARAFFTTAQGPLGEG